MRTIHNYFTLASLKSLNSSIHLKKKNFGLENYHLM